MLVPLGWLMTGAFWLWVHPGRRWLATGVALCCCLCFVIAVKYLQLFFPPRTVSLNYISAQSLGSLCGVALFSASYDRGADAKPWRERTSAPHGRLHHLRRRSRFLLSVPV